MLARRALALAAALVLRVGPCASQQIFNSECDVSTEVDSMQAACCPDEGQCPDGVPLLCPPLCALSVDRFVRNCLVAAPPGSISTEDPAIKALEPLQQVLLNFVPSQS
eukprot:SAG11_NODE_1809_length_4224_cov_5.960000_5_plen_108_part_00